MSNLILSFDPGGTTGVAMWDGAKYDGWQIEGDWHGGIIWDQLDSLSPHTVVCEDFKIRPEKTVTISLEYIGVIKVWCVLRRVPLFMQQPSGVLPPKGSMQDPILRHNNAYFVGMRHARDAARHLIWHQVTTRGETDRLCRY
jgi:hypothetical protein